MEAPLNRGIFAFFFSEFLDQLWQADFHFPATKRIPVNPFSTFGIKCLIIRLYCVKCLFDQCIFINFVFNSFIDSKAFEIRLLLRNTQP